MTPTPLTGFIIHSRPYQEKRAIYQLFSLECGLIDGIGSRGLPLFVPMTLMMSGKGTLKNFKEPFLLTDNPNILNHRLPLSLQYTALYLNEILYKLLPKDTPLAELWQVYYQTLALFEIGCDVLMLQCVLRRFEWRLFIALGVPTLWHADSNDDKIDERGAYRYHNEMGFVPVVLASLPKAEQSKCLMGNEILAMYAFINALQNPLDTIDFGAMDKEILKKINPLFRQIIDELLDFRPLYSRQLWQDLQKFTKP